MRCKASFPSLIELFPSSKAFCDIRRNDETHKDDCDEKVIKVIFQNVECLRWSQLIVV